MKAQLRRMPIIPVGHLDVDAGRRLAFFVRDGNFSKRQTGEMERIEFLEDPGPLEQAE